MASPQSTKIAVGRQKKAPPSVKEVRITPSKMNSAEWVLVITALACLDIFQFILTLFGVGLVIDRIGDIFIAAALLLYLGLRGELSYPPSRNKILLVVAATFVGEEFVGDVAPLWCLDGIVFFIFSRQRNQESKAQEKRLSDISQQLTAYEVRRKVLDLQQKQALKAQEQQQEEIYEEQINEIEAEQEGNDSSSGIPGDNRWINE